MQACKRHRKAALKARRCDTEAEGNLPECRVRELLTKEGWCLVQHSEHCTRQELSLVLAVQSADLFHLQNKAVHWETQCSVIMLGLWSALKCWARIQRHAVRRCHTMLQSKNTSDLISFLLLQEATALRHVGGLDALGGNQKGVKSEFLALTQILC